jgi:transposase
MAARRRLDTPPSGAADRVTATGQLDFARIASQLAKRGCPHGSGLGRTRWVVERTLAWLHRFRRLNLRYERRACVHEAFLTLACALVCWNYLKPVS